MFLFEVDVADVVFIETHEFGFGLIQTFLNGGLTFVVLWVFRNQTFLVIVRFRLFFHLQDRVGFLEGDQRLEETFLQDQWINTSGLLPVFPYRGTPRVEQP
ncbi:hypothetical protein D3C73_849190 [compost metagenome]